MNEVKNKPIKKMRLLTAISGALSVLWGLWIFLSDNLTINIRDNAVNINTVAFMIGMFAFLFFFQFITFYAYDASKAVYKKYSHNDALEGKELIAGSVGSFSVLIVELIIGIFLINQVAFIM